MSFKCRCSCLSFAEYLEIALEHAQVEPSISDRAVSSVDVTKNNVTVMRCSGGDIKVWTLAVRIPGAPIISLYTKMATSSVKKKLVVCGGNGFLGTFRHLQRKPVFTDTSTGSRICKAATARGWDVNSIRYTIDLEFQHETISDSAPVDQESPIGPPSPRLLKHLLGRKMSNGTLQIYYTLQITKTS